MKAPTKQQLKVLAWIKKFMESRGYAPTVREISAAFEIAPTSAISHLIALRAKGVIQYGNKARAIVINPEWR